MNLYSVVYGPKYQAVIWIVKAETEDEAMDKIMKRMNKTSKRDLYVGLLRFEEDGSAYLGDYSE